MTNVQLTDFSKRKGSPFQSKEDQTLKAESSESFEVTSQFSKHKQIQSELLDKVNKKSAEIAYNKPKSDGVFTEVVTHGAFTAPKTSENVRKSPSKSPPNTPATVPKSLLGFPSSANTLALEAKGDLESDKGISQEVKEKVISKLFTLANMVQHVYESKVRVVADFDKFKEKYLKEEVRREKEQSEQLYKLNMSFQSEVVQMIQQLKMDIEATRGNIKNDSEDVNGARPQINEDCQDIAGSRKKDNEETPETELEQNDVFQQDTAENCCAENIQ